MKFEAYPHDTQNCSMMIESCKYDLYSFDVFICAIFIGYYMNISCTFPVSHTVEDLIFLWNFSTPLVVSDDVELPQLDIVESKTEDCTLEYSTGKKLF